MYDTHYVKKVRSTSKDRSNCVCMASSKRCATYRFILSLDGVFSPNSRCWKSESYYNVSWHTISVTHYLYIDMNSSTFWSWCDNWKHALHVWVADRNRWFSPNYHLTSSFASIAITAAWLAQLGERRSAEREDWKQ